MTPTTAIAIIMPAIAGTKYWSAIDSGSGVGVAVAAGASSTVKYVVADDGPYALEPAKLAMIW